LCRRIKKQTREDNEEVKVLHIVRKSKFEMGENKFHTQMGISKIGEKGYSGKVNLLNQSLAIIPI
jgi:hypothetical protein